MPSLFLAQQCVVPIKYCSGQAHGTGAHPSPVAGLCRAVPSSCSMPRGSCPQDPKGCLLPFCQDTLNLKGKDKWHERGRKGLQGDYGMLFYQGLAARVCFPNSIPSHSWRVPGCCSSTHHPPVAWPGLGESTNPPCFSRKTESQSSTVLPLLSHWLCRSGLAQGSVLRSCSFPLGGGKNGSQMDPLQ